MGKLVKMQEARRILSCSVKTLDNYEERGIIHPIHANARLRYFDTDELEAVISQKHEKVCPRKVIAYYRVSTNSQKADLENQRKSIEQWCLASGRSVDEYLYDIGSGMNLKRKNFLRIIDMIENKEISELIVTYKDRLARFAFDLIEERCQANGTKLTVINLQSTSPDREMAEDLLSIIHVFSCRLYGLRKYKIKKEGLIDDKGTQDPPKPE